MTDRSKPKIENLEQQKEQPLTPERAEDGQGGAVDAFIWFEHKPATPPANSQAETL